MPAHGLSDPAIALSLLAAIGIGAQWASAQLRIPAILPLLLIGFLIGPMTGLFNPDAVFGDLLFSGVSVGVAIILFEGALTLRLADISGAERVVVRLITAGVAVTAAVTAAAAHLALDFPWMLALLFGAITSVTGPTVMIPLLRVVRPRERVSRVLRWEGILIDPIGAVLAVIVFEAIIAGMGDPEGAPFLELLKLLAAGTAIGALGGYLNGLVLRRHLIPDYLRNVGTLGTVLLVYAISNMAVPEAGLVAVTVMGLVLANIKGVPKEGILDFKESLSVLLISVLFIVLAARIDPAALLSIGPALGIVLGAVLFIARPLSVFLCTVESKFDWRDKLLMSWMAPRGIVAAAVAALFALRLEEEGYPFADLIVPLTFAVIVTTVVAHSLTAAPLARLLRVAEPEARGVLIVGANPVALTIASELQAIGVKVLVADASWQQIRDARMRGLPTFFGNAVSEYADRKIDLVGIGKLMALSRRPSLNALACLRYRTEFGRADVFTVRRDEQVLDKELEAVSFGFRGRLLFDETMTLDRLEAELASDKEIRLTQITADFGYADLVERAGGKHLLLFAVDPAGGIRPFAENAAFKVAPGWRVAYLAEKEEVERAVVA